VINSLICQELIRNTSNSKLTRKLTEYLLMTSRSNKLIIEFPLQPNMDNRKSNFHRTRRTHMNRYFSILITVSVVLLLVSCGQSRDKMLARISKMDKGIMDMHPADTAKVTELISAYQAFAHKFPEDSLAPEFLYKAAGLCLSFSRSMKAMELYRAIRVDYPTWHKAPECLFMQGFIFENYIKDLVKANEIYNEFISKYPNHDLTDDAVNAIKYLGKPLDDVIRDFEAQNARSDSLKTAGK
jgi:hypothetical protein